MTIFRVEHSKNYTVINNTITRDARLSWKAKGIWLYAFSRPDDWKFHINQLVDQSTDGIDSVRVGLKELEDCGYLQRTRKRDSTGRLIKSDWVFHEIPQLKEKVPQVDFPHMEKPHVENPTLLSTEEYQVQEKKTKYTPPTPASGEAAGAASAGEIAPSSLHSFGTHVKLSQRAFDLLAREHGKDLIHDIIEQINDYLDSTGKKPYKDYAATIRSWLRRRKDNPPQRAAFAQPDPLARHKGFNRDKSPSNPKNTLDLSKEVD